MGTIRGQYSDSIWKTKLRASQSEKKYLARCLARTKKRLCLLQSALKEEKAAHHLLLKQMSQMWSSPLGEVPAGHQFPVFLMYLAIFFQVNLGLSYRQSSAVLGQFLELLSRLQP